MFGLPLLQHFVTATPSRASGLDGWSDTLVVESVYRDWTDHYPDVAQPDKLISGEMGDGRVWLKGIAAKDGAL